MNTLAIVILALTAIFAGPSFAQDKAADNMQMVRDKVRADKKLLVAENMQLTDSEAKAFWPVYESYQRELNRINARTSKVVVAYVGTSPELTEGLAGQLVTEIVAIEADRAKLMQSYLPKFRKILSARKAARYYQIENKIRAVLNYDLAATIPLVN
jgi:hypothetical protein